MGTIIAHHCQRLYFCLQSRTLFNNIQLNGHISIIIALMSRNKSTRCKAEERMENSTRNVATTHPDSGQAHGNNTDIFDKNIISIDVLNDDCLIRIFQYLPIRDKVRIERVSKHWQVVAQNSWHYIKTLNLYKVWATTDINKRVKSNKVHVIGAILKRCGIYLKRIEFFGYLNNLLKLGEQIGSLCPNVQIVHLAGTSSQVIRNLADNCTDIRELCLRDTIDPYDVELSLLFSKNKRLERIEFYCENSFTTGGKFLLDLPIESVRELQIFNSNFSSDYFNETVKKLQNLSKISFDLCEKLNDDTMKVIASNTSLREIQMGLWPGKISCLCPIYSLVHLQVLELSLCSYVSDTFLCRLSEHCRELSIVNISGCPVSDSGVASLTSLPKLEYLSINNNYSITDNAFYPMPNLKILHCYGCEKISYRCFSNIVNTSEQLEELVACYCRITNATIRAAVQVTKNRKNGITLKIYLRGTRVKLSRIKEKSPLLELTFMEKKSCDKDYA